MNIVITPDAEAALRRVTRYVRVEEGRKDRVFVPLMMQWKHLILSEDSNVKPRVRAIIDDEWRQISRDIEQRKGERS